MPRKDGTPTAQEVRDQEAQDRKLAQLEDWSYWQGCACSAETLRQRIEYLERIVVPEHKLLFPPGVVYWQRAAQLRGFRDAAVDRGLARYE